MADITFVTAEVCPYAQRTHLALHEKGLEYDHREVDLANKPAWFEAVSPYSKVPVLKHGDTVVYESAIINEYLDEVFPEPRLMPADPATRAKARIWIDYCNTRFVSAFYAVLSAQGDEAQRAAAETVTAQLNTIEDEGLAKLGDGPYWLGAEVSLVDLTYWPHFERFAAVSHYRDVAIPERCTRLRAWIDAMRGRASVVATQHEDAYYIKSYSRYAEAA